MLLEVKELHAGYDDKEIIHGASFEIDHGEFVCIIGANGCGKTTMLKNILGLIKPMSGQVLISGKDASAMNEREHAQYLAYIPQVHKPPFPFRAADVVIMGRTPYLNELSRISPKDRRIAYDAIEQLGITHLADKSYTQLSGGQQQLVLIARALAQQTDLRIMDEPTASLDFGNQHLVLSRMRSLTDRGQSVLMVTHDPNHAFFVADRVIVVRDGLIVQNGSPREVITTECLHEIYDADVSIIEAKDKNGEPRYVCVPL